MSNDIYLYDTIGGPTANAAGLLPKVQAADPGRPITVHIHSPGGSVLDGEAILSQLRSHPAGFVANVSGMAFSMAANIALSADKVYMPADGWLMFHFARSQSGGTASELARQKRILDKMDEALLDKLEYRLGPNNPGRETLDVRLAEDWYIDGKEALQLGLVDALTNDAALAACSCDRPGGAPAECLEYLDNSTRKMESATRLTKNDEKIIFLARNHSRG
tara:strand:+ start:2415 stop:3074 length:660 start_codon:yes stop_codon:yes gene_type:complete